MGFWGCGETFSAIAKTINAGRKVIVQVKVKVTSSIDGCNIFS